MTREAFNDRLLSKEIDARMCKCGSEPRSNSGATAAPSPSPPPGDLGASHGHNHWNFIYKHKAGAGGGREGGHGRTYFCSRLQTMTMPLASLEASRLSSQLKLTSSTGALWPCSLLTAALAARSTSKKCTHMSSLPVTARGTETEGRREVLPDTAGGPWVWGGLGGTVPGPGSPSCFSPASRV